MVNTTHLAGSSTLLGAPREVRDRIYDYVFLCDFEYPVEVNAVSPKDHRLYTLPTESVDVYSPDKFLALLHVNHQISDEAACRFYGKRTFSGYSKDLCLFLRGIGQRRTLLRKVEIYSFGIITEIYLTHLRDLLSEMSTLGALTLCRFRMAEDEHSYQSVHQSLIDNGIHKLRCELEVCNKRSCLRLDLPPNSATRTTVRFLTRWTCAKNSLEWKRGQLHCRTLARKSPGTRTWVEVEEPQTELCDHIHEYI